jgi:hypothetical protein
MCEAICPPLGRSSTPPHWEWRTFGPDLSALEAKIGPAADVPSHRSEELYLTHARSPHNAKIRDATLDVKRLKAAAASGFELWDVAMKHGFPLARADILALFEALDLATPLVRDSLFALEEFLDEVIGREEAFRATPVKKSRRSFPLGGRLAELVLLEIGGRFHESFRVEDEGPDRLLATPSDFGLDPAANVNYPKSLKSEFA